MRHRSVASIVSAFALTLALTACQGAQMFVESSSQAPRPGPMAPFPELPHSQLTPLQPPSNTPGEALNSDALKQPLKALLEGAAENKNNLWVRVIDLHSGNVLLNHNADTPHTPASTTKILTALTALSHLDENATLATGTSLSGSTVYLWGEGDLLLTPDETQPYDTNGRASLRHLARQTAHALTQKNTTTITLNWAPQPFDGPSHLPQWQTQEVEEYEGHVAAYAIDSGTQPENGAFSPNPAQDVAHAFAQALTQDGITVTLGKEATPDTQAEKLATVASATIGEQIRYMLAQSDNTMADQLCRLSAQKAATTTSYTGATQLIRTTLEKLNIPTAGLTLEDCSGLSINNKVPPHILTDALRNSALSDKPALRDLLRSLPWARAQGTMTTRFYDGPAIGNVQAKTGSLASVSSLAGIVHTSTGRELIFAMGVDQTEEGSAYYTRPAIDAFIQELTTL